MCIRDRSIIGKVDEVNEDDWQFGVDILLNAVIQMSTVFLPYLQKRPEAAIVNVSSIFGLFSVPKQSIYNVGKFGVKAFTESLSLEMEMSESPVEVYCVFPGHIGTNIYSSSRFKSFEADDAGAAIFGANASTIEEAGAQFKQNAPSSPEFAAKTILRNIKKKNKRILIGFDAKFYDLMSRLFPKNFLKIISNKGTIAYDKNIMQLDNKTEISGKVNEKDILGKASKVDIDLNKRNLSSDELIIFIDEYEISVKEIILNEDEIVFKGSPVYLKDNKGLETETSMVKLKSNGELIFPSKLNIKNY